MAGKYRLGVRRFPEPFVVEFVSKIQEFIQNVQYSATSERLRNFWAEQNCEIGDFIRAQIDQLELCVLHT